MMNYLAQRTLGRTPMVLTVLVLLASAASGDVVVESLPPGSALARSGVEPGDVLEVWGPVTLTAEPVSIGTPFSFETLRVEQAPRGAVQLRGKRRGEVVSFVVEPGDWQAQVRPVMTQAALQAYDTVRREIEEGRFEDALEHVGFTVRGVRQSGDLELECWWWLRVGEFLVEARAFKAAHTAFRNAQKVARSKEIQAVVARAVGRLGDAEEDLEIVGKAHRAILALYGEEASESILAARSHTRLGEISWDRGEIDKLEEHWREALAITQAVAPRSYASGTCLNDVAYLEYFQGESEAAASYLKQAHSVLVEIAPRSSEFSTTLYYLGILEHHHGRFKNALEYFQQALEIAETLKPSGQDLRVASLSSAMGKLLRLAGDLALAEEYLHRAASIEERQIPGSSQLAYTLTALAIVLEESGRAVAAQGYLRRALAIAQELDNDLLLSLVQGNLANLLVNSGQHEGAERHFKRMLETEKRLTPGSTGIPWALLNLGRLAENRGDLVAAETSYYEAVAFLEREAPRHLYLQFVLTHLGDLALRRGRPGGDAERFYRRALDVRGDASSLSKTDVYHGLGRALVRHGQFDAAAAEFQRAVAVFEDQLRRMGGSRHSQGSFRAQHREIYDDALAAELAAGHPERAFHLLERSRARSLLEMLTERDLDFSLDLPEEMVATQRELESRYRAAMNEALASGDEVVLQEQRDELARLREEQESFEARLRRASPRFAALRYPAPHGVPEVRGSLDPGTVLLAYNVAGERTDLFMVTPEDGLVDTLTLPVGAQELRQRVEAYLDLLTRRRDPHSPFFRSLTEAGRELYDLLIAPAESVIERSVRLLIVPDGTLHQLPFAALVRPTGEYMAGWRPLHTVLSATLYTQLREGRRPNGQQVTGGSTPASKIAAFGDPLYPSWIRREPEAIAEPRLRSAVRGGLFNWDPLPHTRREVESIAALYPRQDVFLYLGGGATEEAVRALEPGLEIVHFAVHGHLDDRFPLNSALALAMPETLDGTRHNGLLQAWEIFDSVRLDADLVVLSACSTALGQERGGEGLVGLVHAFHYAGARSLLASLWNVNDRVTAELMIRFHRHLRQGLSKDEALRAAQLEFLEGPIVVEDGAYGTLQDATAPYYWAAFQILGDR